MIVNNPARNSRFRCLVRRKPAGHLRGIGWLPGRTSHLALSRLAAVALALSVGVSNFLVAYFLRDTLGANFQYFIFARH
jgi:hypothetical protein